MVDLPDIDIDVKDREKVLKTLNCVPASRTENNDLIAHPSGVYFQDIPIDLVSGLSAIPFKEAEQLGFFKVDFLAKHSYNEVQSRGHLRELLSREPMFELLEYPEIVQELDQISQHFSVVHQMKPRSVEQLGMVIAMIRPGKRYLIGRDWKEVEQKIWEKEPDGFMFKKSHSIAYALQICVQLNLIQDRLSQAT